MKIFIVNARSASRSGRFPYFLKLSFRLTLRLNTRCPGPESLLSRQKYPSRMNWKFAGATASPRPASTLQPVRISRELGFSQSIKSLSAASGAASENRLS